MLPVFDSNWFSIFICFFKLATKHRFPLVLHTHTQTHTQFLLRVYRHLQSGCRFCKQNLLRLQPSVSTTHQRPCLSEHHIHTITCARMGVDWIQHGQQGRRRKLFNTLSVRHLPSPRSCFITWRGTYLTVATFVHVPSQEQENVPPPELVSSHTAAHHLTQTDSLIKRDIDIEKGFPLVAGLWQYDDKMKSLFFLSVCQPAACQCVIHNSSPNLVSPKLSNLI